MTAELLLLTINLWGLPWPVARARRDRKRRFHEHLVRFPYDLVAIQELWWPWQRSLRAARLHFPHARRDSGLALGGRLRPTEPLRLDPFRDHAGTDRVKRKGVLRTAVEALPGVRLAVYVTHLQAGLRHARVRRHQVDQLLGLLTNEPRPLLLMGDFNLHGSSEEDHRSAARLRAAGLSDAAGALAREEHTYPAFSRLRAGRERFDRVYLRGARGLALEPLEVNVLRPWSRPLSDHHPLRVRAVLSG